MQPLKHLVPISERYPYLLVPKDLAIYGEDAKAHWFLG
jgi:hypothetical protein